MPMPKGYRSEFGYATVAGQEGCLTYREIAEIMTNDGDKVNHSTARNIFLRAMRKIATQITAQQQHGDPHKVAEDPRFQEAVQQLASEVS
jgi:pyoverdine/dityrosine biosynthesis protein Dit1